MDVNADIGTGTIIRCSVQNCVYWRKDNYCSAQHILVTSDIVAGAWLKDADEAAMNSAPLSPVSSKDGSCCATFVAKNPA